MIRFLGTCLLVLTAQIVGASEVVRLSAEQRARAGIEVATATTSEFSDRIRAVGMVVRSPGSTLVLKTIVGGRIETLEVAPGDRVHRGQIVATIHSHDMLTMQSELLLAMDQVALAERQLDAGRELLAIDGISRIELERREQTLLSARLRYRTLREELLDHGMPESHLDQILEGQRLDPHLPVASPVDGVILEISVHEQEWVQSFAPLMVVGDPVRIELELQLAPDLAASVTEGDVVEFNPVGRAGEGGLATVITRVPQIDPATRTVLLRARIDKNLAPSFPGSFVEATVSTGAVRQRLEVPDSAVISLAGGDVVFVSSGANEFEVRPVTVGESRENRYEIVDGLREGEEIAVSGVFLLKSALVKSEGGED